MRLSLRFIIPLFLALGALAYAVVRSSIGSRYSGSSGISTFAPR